MGADGGSTTGVMTERGYYADHAATQRSASTYDAGAYGASQAGFLRGFLEPSFRAAPAARPAGDQTRLLDAVFAETAARIAADPAAVGPDYRVVTGRIQRTA